jgi:hypothetical protein
MKANPVASADPISAYLSQVSTGLADISEFERQEILAEIRSHLSERVQQFTAQGFLQPAEAAIAVMGDPDELALQFTRTASQKKASRSFVPWVLLKAAARLAFTGIKGLLAFLLGLLGYASALGFTLAAALKPIVPSKVGFWIGPHLFVWGMPGETMHSHELAGQYFIPVSVAFAFLLASGTTLALRWLTRPEFSLESVLRRKPR